MTDRIAAQAYAVLDVDERVEFAGLLAEAAREVGEGPGGVDAEGLIGEFGVIASTPDAARG